METRHGCVLVGDALEGAGVERPQPAGVDERVDEPVSGLTSAEFGGGVFEQPRGHQRECGEPHKSDCGGGGERRAHAQIAHRVASEQIDHHAERDRKVKRTVEDVPEADEPVVGDELRLNPLLMEQVKSAFEIDYAFRVAQGTVSDVPADR